MKTGTVTSGIKVLHWEEINGTYKCTYINGIDEPFQFILTSKDQLLSNIKSVIS